MKNVTHTNDEASLGTGIQSMARQLVCFTSGSGSFGVDVGYVRRIITVPTYAGGDEMDRRSINVVAFEEEDIPLVDVNSVTPNIPASIDSIRVIVVACEGILIGLMANVVSQILHIPSASISDRPAEDTDYGLNVEGVYWQDDETIHIVNCRRLVQTWSEKTPNSNNSIKSEKASMNYDR